MMIGILITILIFGVASFFLFSTASGPVGLTKALGVGTVGGIVGTITAIFSNAYEFFTASAMGKLGLYGYLFVGGVALCLVIWAWNGLQDLKANRPLSFVE